MRADMHSSTLGDGHRALLKDDSCEVPEGGMLQEYCTDFVRLRAVVVTKIQALRDVPHGASCSEEAAAVEKALSEIEANRRQVQVQLRLELSGAPSAKQAWEKRLQEWSRELASLRSELNAAKQEKQRSALQLCSPAELAASSAERQSALQATEQLRSSNSKLDQAIREAAESEEVSAGILSDLAVQRETILRSSGNMHVVDTELSSSHKILNRMASMAMRNKLVTLITVVILSVGLSVWIFGLLGLPLKQTILLSMGVLLVGTLMVFLYQHYQKRSAARDLV